MPKFDVLVEAAKFSMSTQRKLFFAHWDIAHLNLQEIAKKSSQTHRLLGLKPCHHSKTVAEIIAEVFIDYLSERVTCNDSRDLYSQHKHDEPIMKAEQ